MKHIYSLEEDKFLRDNVKGITEKKLTKLFNKKFMCNLSENAIGCRKNKLHLKSGITGGQFKKGNISHNKGKKWSDFMSEQGRLNSLNTTFKKGNIPHNYRPVGSERITKDGYVEIKIKDPNKWQLKHRYIYELIKGKIPDGYNLIFADGNMQNIDIDNLILVTKAEELIMNNNKLFYEDKELTKTGTIIAKIIYKSSKLKKGDK